MSILAREVLHSRIGLALLFFGAGFTKRVVGSNPDEAALVVRILDRDGGSVVQDEAKLVWNAKTVAVDAAHAAANLSLEPEPLVRTAG